jgi:hypothetical protein
MRRRLEEKRHTKARKAVLGSVRYGLAGIALIFVLLFSLRPLLCRPQSSYDSISRIEFSRRGPTQALTKSDGTIIPGGCQISADATPKNVKFWAVACRREKDGSLIPQGYVYYAPTKQPGEIFKSLVSVLQRANALDLSAPAEKNPANNYAITIDIIGAAKVISVDAASSRKLSAEESTILDLFEQLQDESVRLMVPVASV